MDTAEFGAQKKDDTVSGSSMARAIKWLYKPFTPTLGGGSLRSFIANLTPQPWSATSLPYLSEFIIF